MNTDFILMKTNIKGAGAVIELKLIKTLVEKLKTEIDEIKVGFREA